LSGIGFYFDLSGSSPVIESEGIVTGAPTITFNNSIGSAGTVTTTSTVALAANRGIQLDGSGGTLDVSNSPTGFTATVNGSISGIGALTKTGAGTLNLTASNGYGGATTVSGGTMIVSGSLSGTVSASVAAGATLEVDGLLNSSAAATVNGTLRGTGSTGPITTQGGTLAPGLTAANSSISEGTLTAGGNVTLSSTTNFSIRLGMVTGNSGDNDQLAVSSGTVSLAGANLQLTIGNFLNNPADIGLTYVIINGGDTAGSGTFAQGSSITANGYSFNIIYDTNAAGGGFGTGNDVVLQLTAIPEPGTWATMLSGFGMLLVVQRLRRKTRS